VYNTSPSAKDESKLFGLIGYPLEQSFSKKYFDKKIRDEGLTNCRFENFSIEDIEKLKNILANNPDLRGLAVTIPYKQQVLPFLTTTENIPIGLRACNCIKITDGRLSGYNTDHIGFQKSFEPLLQQHHKNALVLGNGGSTEAVVYVLKKLNIDFEIVSRQLHDGSTLTYNELTEEIISKHKLIINTTPLGMFPKVEACPTIPYSFITTSHYLYDLVYNPSETLFLQKGKGKGAIIKNGADMLELQAEENWKIWNE
jgi:shikimate dehydrogenase